MRFQHQLRHNHLKEHEDYLSLTTNMIEEYTGIMCLNANCEGGETILNFNGLFFGSQFLNT